MNAGLGAGDAAVDRARQHAAADRRRRAAADAGAACGRGSPSRHAPRRRCARAGSAAGRRCASAGAPLDVDVAFHTAALREPCALLRAQLAAEPALLPDPAVLGAGGPLAGGRQRSARELATSPGRSRPRSSSRRCAGTSSRDGSPAAGADWVLDLGPGHRRRGADGREPARRRRPHPGARLARGAPAPRRRRAPRPPAPTCATRSFAPGVVELPGGRPPPRRPLHPPDRAPAGDPRRDDADDEPTRRSSQRPPTPATPPSSPAAASRTAGRSSGASRSCASCCSPAARSSSTRCCSIAHLWALHVARDRLVVEARRGGAPLAGLTVSAGIPDVAYAVALAFDEPWWPVAGRRRVREPGTAAEVRQRAGDR